MRPAGIADRSLPHVFTGVSSAREPQAPAVPNRSPAKVPRVGSKSNVVSTASGHMSRHDERIRGSSMDHSHAEDVVTEAEDAHTVSKAYFFDGTNGDDEEKPSVLLNMRGCPSFSVIPRVEAPTVSGCPFVLTPPSTPAMFLSPATSFVNLHRPMTSSTSITNVVAAPIDTTDGASWFAPSSPTSVALPVRKGLSLASSAPTSPLQPQPPSAEKSPPLGANGLTVRNRTNSFRSAMMAERRSSSRELSGELSDWTEESKHSPGADKGTSIGALEKTHSGRFSRSSSLKQLPPPSPVRMLSAKLQLDGDAGPGPGSGAIGGVAVTVLDAELSPRTLLASESDDAFAPPSLGRDDVRSLLVRQEALESVRFVRSLHASKTNSLRSVVDDEATDAAL